MLSSTGSRGGGVSSCSLNRFVRHDAGGKLLLRLLETGAGVSCLRQSTFLNMMSEMTADAVKRAAIRIMMMPTGILAFNPVRAEIQPLHEFLPSKTRRWTDGVSPGSPACDSNGLKHMDAELADIDEEEDEEPERAVAPEKMQHSLFRKLRVIHGVYLKAPYRGLYQQTNEHGVKSMNQSIAKPKSTPLEESTQNQDKQPKMLANSVPVWTEKELGSFPLQLLLSPHELGLGSCLILNTSPQNIYLHPLLQVLPCPRTKVKRQNFPLWDPRLTLKAASHDMLPPAWSKFFTRPSVSPCGS
ncbi:hypothetical protein DNTS_004695 [Danionella cerebrum]|uniref:Uncharacterized protein n=1 Tax=Danionella cerebrum TaxID=2873325 RepID=A0A553QZ26_9TELE|nr:hypothetical protein DNTS_004695 [Danionella translucida]